MDRVNHYREIVRRTVEEYAGQKPSVGEVDSYPPIDPERDHYLAVQNGWVNRHRVNGAFVHIDIKDGKVWVQHDGTDRPVADALTAAGIPKEDIVLGFQPPDVRPFTGYGVG
jgi:XisI protein